MRGGCRYVIAYVGECVNKSADGTDYCSKHLGKKCVVCGEQATHECHETCGLVCGDPLCNNCEHEVVNGKSTWHHVRKVSSHADQR